MTNEIQVRCCIAGGGPAGMMLGYLLGRGGVDTVVLEKHADFLRDFRGDTVHPSTLRIINELGLLEEFLQLPHSEIRSLSVEVGRSVFKLADFGRLGKPGNFIALMPQWDFLNFLAQRGRRFPSLKVLMSAEVTGLIEGGGRVAGVHAISQGAPLEVHADLVIGCDGRASTVRALSGLTVKSLGSPIDVLWFRLSRKLADPGEVLGHLGTDKMLVTIDRSDYWQCAYVIDKGGNERVRAAGLEAFKAAVIDGARFLSDRVHELQCFDDVKLLSVSVDRLTTWSKPGLLCIGDAAHAMSPIGGVGINLAIQDAVAVANALAAPLCSRTVSEDVLSQIQRRRELPTIITQRLQIFIQNMVIGRIPATHEKTMQAPSFLKLLTMFPALQRIPARLVG